MSRFSSRNRMRIAILTASLVFAPIVFADIVDSSPLAPPTFAVYTVPDTCVSVVCLENITLSDFNVTNSQIVGGNELTVSNVDLKANLFQNVSGAPGAFITPIVLSGQIDITYFSKDALNSFGTFNDQITFLDLSGSFVGLTGPHQIEAMLNPDQQSTGQTTITPITSEPPAFQVDSFFDVFAELKIDSGPFVPGPEREADLTNAPEPAFCGAIGAVFALMAMRRIVRPKRVNAQFLASK